jgi:hypothetical protein
VQKKCRRTHCDSLAQWPESTQSTDSITECFKPSCEEKSSALVRHTASFIHPRLLGTHQTQLLQANPKRHELVVGCCCSANPMAACAGTHRPHMYVCSNQHTQHMLLSYVAARCLMLPPLLALAVALLFSHAAACAHVCMTAQHPPQPSPVWRCV